MFSDRYEIIGKVGRGGVGEVYKAYDNQLQRNVAIKRMLIDESSDIAAAAESLLKEATALSSVQHPHICTVYDAGVDETGPFVVMEFINGNTLEEMIEKGTFVYSDFRELAIQSLEAMIAAQELDLIHRDLKPSNLMINWLPSGRFQVKLVDFGLAKFSSKPSLQTIDHSDAVFGSIFFMAPEQFERVALDRRTDMYSLGALFYYALTGSYPFDGDSAPQVMASHLQNSVQPLIEIRPDLPAWLCDWVMWHIQRNMEARPDSAKIALEQFLEKEKLEENNRIQASIDAKVAEQTSSYTLKPAIAENNSPNNSAMNQLTGATLVQPVKPVQTPKLYTGVTLKDSHSDSPLNTNSFASQTSESIVIGDTNIPGQSQTLPEKKQSRSLILTLLFIGLTAIGTFTLFLRNSNAKENNLHKILLDLNYSTKNIPTSKEDFLILLDALQSPKFKDSTLKILRRLDLSEDSDEFNLEERIADIIIESTNLSDSTLKNLCSLIFKRREISSIQKIVSFVSNEIDSHKTMIILSSTNRSKKISDSFFKPSLKVLSNSSNTKTKLAAELILNRMLLLKPNSKKLFEALNDEFLSAEHPLKLACIRLFRNCQNKKCLHLLTLQFKSPDKSLRLAASSSLSQWKDLSPASKLIEQFSKEKDPSVRRSMFNNCIQYFNSHREFGLQLEPHMTVIVEHANNTFEYKKIVAFLKSLQKPWSNALLAIIKSNPKYPKGIKDSI